MAPLRKRPHWWDWELVFSTHVEERMQERGTHQLALRWMLQHCAKVRRGSVAGRFVAEARYRGGNWEIVLEPDHERACIVVVTMYNVGAK